MSPPARGKIPLYKQKRGSVKVPRELGKTFSSYTHPYRGYQAFFFRDLHEKIIKYDQEKKGLLVNFLKFISENQEEEIGEGAVINFYAPEEDFVKVKQILGKFRSMFFRLAIRDFCTGYERSGEEFLYSLNIKEFGLQDFLFFLAEGGCDE